MPALSPFERAIRPFTIPNLTQVLTYAMAIVYVIGFAVPQLDVALTLVPQAVWAGEVWRLLTFITVTGIGHQGLSVVFAFFAIYIFYLTGSTVENQWGSVRFNLYIFCVTFLTMIFAMIPPFFDSGYMTPVFFQNVFIVWTVFLAFAVMVPNMEFLLFFVLPVKVKYLAWFSGAINFYYLIAPSTNYGLRRAILAAFITFGVFFGKEIYVTMRYGRRKLQQRVRVMREEAAEAAPFHTCAECGITNLTHPEEDFRYCPECEGQLAYCSKHIFNHEHRK